MPDDDVDLNLLAQIIPASQALGPRLLGRRVSDDYGSADRIRMSDVLAASGDGDDPLVTLAQALNAARTAHQIHDLTKAYALASAARIVGAAPAPPAPTPPSPTPPGPSPQPTPTPPAPDAAVVWDDQEQVLDQGQTGHCVGFGWADWGNTLPVDDHYAGADGHAIYYECKVIDGEPRAENGSSVHSGATAMKNRGRIAGYAWDDNVQAAAAWITTKGPVVLGTDWYDGMFEPDANGLVVPTGNIAGGHCYLALGWDPSTRLFECLNSWGPSWSKQGHFWIKDTDLQGLLDNQGEACAGLEIAA